MVESLLTREEWQYVVWILEISLLPMYLESLRITEHTAVSTQTDTANCNPSCTCALRI